MDKRRQAAGRWQEAEAAQRGRECGTEMVLLRPKELSANKQFVVKTVLVLLALIVVIPTVLLAGCSLIIALNR